MKIGISAGLAVGLVAIALAAPAAQAHQAQIQVDGQAAHGLTVQSRVMRFGDLNLANEDGRARLEKRLKITAATVCGQRTQWKVNPPADYTRCLDRAVGDARAQLQQRIAAGESTIRVASR